MADYDIKEVLKEVEAEISRKEDGKTLPAFQKGHNRKFVLEPFHRERLEDCLAQSWDMGYIEMEIAPSVSKLKRKVKGIVARAVGICLLPVCRKQSLYNLNSAEMIHLLYARITELENENRCQQNRIEKLESQMSEWMEAGKKL